mgnify:CR=1 FL=1
MNEFPTHPDIRLNSIAWVESIFNYAVLKGDALFTAITFGIRSVLDFLELLFVLMVLSSSAFMWPSQGINTALGSAVFVTVVISGIDYIISWTRRVKFHDIHA